MLTTVEEDTLYDRDLQDWFTDTIAKIKSKEFDRVDWEHVIEEIEGLAGRDRAEVQSRLRVLLAHMLKRLYVDSTYDYRGWENTIREQRRQLETLLEQSPSMRSFLDDVFLKEWQKALTDVRHEYPKTQFPDRWQFKFDVDALLSEEFWQES
jgi:vacuolar-type H+-ATPase catalytic subunit A/Vma1